MDISGIGDVELLTRTESLASAEKAAVADLVEHLAEVDRRRLWKGSHGSLFEYCVYRLRMHPASAFHRIRAARAFAAYPPILELLRDGRLTLEAVVLLHPHLSAPDAAKVVTKAVGMNHRQLETFLASRRTEEPKRDVIRRLGPPPSDAPSSPESPLLAFQDGAGRPSGYSPQDAAGAAGPRPNQPTEPRPVRFAFTGDDELLRLIDRARQLLRHKHPDGRLEAVIREALRALLERKDPFVKWSRAARRA